MALAAFVVLIALAIALFVVFALASGARSAKTGAEDVAPAEALDGPVVTYEVPEGQDPVALLTTLRQAGYEAQPGHPPTPPVVHVACRPGDREELRRTIASAPANIEGDSAERAGVATRPVRFTDEGA